MKLYYAKGACSLATYILLNEAKLPFDAVKVSTKEHTTETGEDYYKINPKGYVPALQLDDGEIVTENVVIHAYIASLAPQAKLAPPPGTRERLRYDQLAVFITTEIHKTYSPLFSNLAEDAKAFFRENLVKRYETIEKILSDGRPYLTGPDFQTVDAYLFTVTRWAAGAKVDISKFAKVQAYQERVAARPAVKAAMLAEGIIAAA
ncbi:MAG TPA: glutathione transferase GstA [Hyphomonadaceae bacterium]|nr:glutathione transferase GstA [Hyphomonadaceae bacterium]